MITKGQQFISYSSCSGRQTRGVAPVRRSRRGHGLVELLVSTIILGLGLAGLAQLYLASMWTYQKSRYLSLATERAQYELEHVRNIGFAPLTPDSPDALVPTYYPADRYTALPSGRGVKFTISDLPKGQGTITITKFRGYKYLLLVTIDMNWAGSTHAQTKVQFTTLISKAM